MFGQAGPAALGFLAGSLVKSSVVLVLALAAAALLRRKPAALRHFALSAFLISLLLLPLLSLAPGGWRTRLLPGERPATPVFPAPIHSSSPAGGSGLGGIAVPGAPETLLIAGEAGVAEARLPRAAGAGSAATRRSSSLLIQAAGRALGRAALAAWAAGALFLLLRLGLGLAGAARLTREGKPLLEPAWRRLLARFLAAVSLRRNVRLKSHGAVSVPLTWGFVRPVILLPSGTENWTEDERSTVLCHELSHIKRADFLVTLLVRTSLAVAWPNPLTWVVFGLLRREQEKACDEMVLRTGLKPSVYAAHLLAFRRAAGRRCEPAAALLGLFGRSPLQERLAAILKHNPVFREVTMKTKLALGCAVILSVALIGTARPAPVAIQVPSVSASPAGPAVAAAPAQATQPVQTASAGTPAAQEEKEKAKAKAEAEAAKPFAGKKIVVTRAAGNTGHIEIVVTEGDIVKSFISDEAAIIIKRASAGRDIVISSGGQEFVVGRSGDVRIEIKGGELKIVKEGETLKIGEGEVLLRAAEPGLMILKEKQAKGENDEFTWVTVEPGAKARDGIDFVAAGPELEKKLMEIREQLRQVKEQKLAIEEVEKNLEALTEELKKEPSFRRPVLKLGKHPSTSFTIYSDDKKLARSETGISITVAAKERTGLTIVFAVHPGKIGHERYEQTVAELKRALPEGYTLDPEFREDSGAIVATVKGPRLEKGALEDLIEKLAAIMKKAAPQDVGGDK